MVYCRDVLEHLRDDRQAIYEMKRVGKQIVIVLFHKIAETTEIVSIGHGTFDNDYGKRLLSHLGAHRRFEIGYNRFSSGRSLNVEARNFMTELECRSGVVMPELKPLAEQDLEFVRQFRNQSRKWFFAEQVVSQEEHRVWYARLQRQSDVRFYVICELGQRVGTISLTHGGEAIEIGNLMLDEAYQGRGIMQEACRMLIEPGKKYVARVKPKNQKSLKLFERLGFKPTEVLLERAG